MATRSVRATLAQLFKDVLGRILVTLGLHRPLLKGRAIVVAFHSVTPDLTDGALRCSVRDFERYCAFFARHLKVERYTALIERLERKGPLNGELSITFDDGYADNEELALPILERWRLPATFFVTSGFVESETQAFWDQSASLRSRWMNWPQVKRLSDAGHDIGGHTVNHVDLAKLDAREAESELRLSREELTRHVGVAPIHFAIPFGRTFPSIEEKVRIARDVGFRSVSLCRGGVVNYANSSMCIERWPVNPGAYLSPYGWIVDVIRDAGVGGSVSY